MAGDPENARAINRKLVINYIKNNKNTSRAILARKLNLSKMTISAIVSDFMEEGILQETGIGESKNQGGRKPILLKLNEEDWYVVGIDIGYSFLSISVGNLYGKILESMKIPFQRNHSVQNIILQISKAYDCILSLPACKDKNYIGVGASMGGLVDIKTGVVHYSPDFGWRDVPLKKLLEEQFNVPVIVNNCTRTMALGELWFSELSEKEDFVFINIGYGIGSAIYLNRNIFQKNSEFGHIQVTDEKVQCECGNYGCLETVASGRAIERNINKVKGNPNVWITAKEGCALAKQGDVEIREVFETAGYYMGKALAIFANLFNPQTIIIGGGISNCGDVFMDSILETFNKQAMQGIRDTTEVKISSLKDNCGIKGAVALALDYFIYRK